MTENPSNESFLLTIAYGNATNQENPIIKNVITVDCNLNNLVIPLQVFDANITMVKMM